MRVPLNILFTGTTEASGNNRCTKTGMTSDHTLHVLFDMLFPFVYRVIWGN